MNPRIHEIALQTGGSHYPHVGGKLLEQAILLAVSECAQIARSNGDNETARMILERFGLPSEHEK